MILYLTLGLKSTTFLLAFQWDNWTVNNSKKAWTIEGNLSIICPYLWFTLYGPYGGIDMHEINLLNIQLMDMELFLAAAQYGSFTKAGEKMFMTQSWVSKRINLLESELGLHLFVRNKRNISLTPAGQELRRRLQGITNDILNAIQAAHVAQTGAIGSLYLGYLEWGTLVFRERLENFIEQNPQISVEVYRQSFSELRSKISTNRLDLIFTTSYDCDQLSTNDYNILQVQKVPLVAYMHKKHPLANNDKVEVKDLRAEPLLMVDENSSPGYCNYIRQLFLEHDIRPLIAQYAHDGGAHIGSILINKGILLASQCFLENSWQDQIARPIVCDANLYINTIWKKQNTNPVLAKFLQHAICC